MAMNCFLATANPVAGRISEQQTTGCRALPHFTAKRDDPTAA